MPRYRRERVPGGTFFFTVNLLERCWRLLVEHADALRASFRASLDAQPFEVIAIVILPIIFTACGGYPKAMRTMWGVGWGSNPGFVVVCWRSNIVPRYALLVVNAVSGNDGSGGIRFATTPICGITSITFTSILRNTMMSQRYAIGRIRRSIVMSAWVCCRWIGRARDKRWVSPLRSLANETSIDDAKGHAMRGVCVSIVRLCALLQHRVEHLRDGALFGGGESADLFELLLNLRSRPALGGAAFWPRCRCKACSPYITARRSAR